MRPHLVVKFEITSEAYFSLAKIAVVVQIDILIFYTTPYSLHPPEPVDSKDWNDLNPKVHIAGKGLSSHG